MRNDYNIKIAFTSRELSARERISIKDTSNCESLDELTRGGEININLDYYVELAVHNEHAKDADYAKYVLVDRTGTRYITGSKTFYDSFIDIYEELSEAGEPIDITATRVPSKNYQGKEFLKCVVK